MLITSDRRIGTPEYSDDVEGQPKNTESNVEEESWRTVEEENTDCDETELSDEVENVQRTTQAFKLLRFD